MNSQQLTNKNAEIKNIAPNVHVLLGVSIGEIGRIINM